jgi:hypothetical protein
MQKVVGTTALFFVHFFDFFLFFYYLQISIHVRSHYWVVYKGGIYSGVGGGGGVCV